MTLSNAVASIADLESSLRHFAWSVADNFRFHELAGSTEHLTLTGFRGRLDRVQHAMARDRVFERRAQMRSLSIIASETHVRLGYVSGSALKWRRPILL